MEPLLSISQTMVPKSVTRSSSRASKYQQIQLMLVWIVTTNKSPFLIASMAEPVLRSQTPVDSPSTKHVLLTRYGIPRINCGRSPTARISHVIVDRQQYHSDLAKTQSVHP